MSWSHREAVSSQLTYAYLVQSSGELNAVVSKITREAAKKEEQELLRADMLTVVQNDI